MCDWAEKNWMLVGFLLVQNSFTFDFPQTVTFPGTDIPVSQSERTHDFAMFILILCFQ